MFLYIISFPFQHKDYSNFWRPIPLVKIYHVTKYLCIFVTFIFFMIISMYHFFVFITSDSLQNKRFHSPFIRNSSLSPSLEIVGEQISLDISIFQVSEPMVKDPSYVTSSIHTLLQLRITLSIYFFHLYPCLQWHFAFYSFKSTFDHLDPFFTGLYGTEYTSIPW